MERRISLGSAFFLIATSATFQLIGVGAGLIPGLGTIWEWFGYIVFFVWFAILGVSFMSGKKAIQKFGAMFGGLVIDSLPIIGSFPAQTLSVIMVVLMTMEEDRETASKQAAAAKAKQVSQRAANDNRLQAANDNQEEDESQYAA